MLFSVVEWRCVRAAKTLRLLVVFRCFLFKFPTIFAERPKEYGSHLSLLELPKRQTVESFAFRSKDMAFLCSTRSNFQNFWLHVPLFLCRKFHPTAITPTANDQVTFTTCTHDQVSPLAPTSSEIPREITHRVKFSFCSWN